MKPRLLHPERDIDLNVAPPWGADALVQDLGLDTMLAAMAGEDEAITTVSRALLLQGQGSDIETILYRQAVLRDCLAQPAAVRALYAVAVEAGEEADRHYVGVLSRHPSRVLRRAVEHLEGFLGLIGRLRAIADRHGESFASSGWTAFFAAVKRELDDDHVARIERHLRELRFRDGMWLSARLGAGNKAAGYVLRTPPEQAPSWLARLFDRGAPSYGFTIAPRDEGGARALDELRDRGMALVADALARSVAHVRSFFRLLRRELAFYVGCMNLHDRLTGKAEPLCFPQPAPGEARSLSFRGLYDACLTLSLDERAVGNDVDADGRDLVIVTGANQGGKSTFLRSVGLAQLMMQAGMMVPAEAFRASLRDRLFTHFRREEDATMESGRLDEELGRMSRVVDHVTPRSMVLFNESFAATNEREGSEIARHVVQALLEARVRMVFVTHLYDYAHGVYETKADNVLFLRAGRRADGSRTFRLSQGEPSRTSFGEDLYERIFDAAGSSPAAAR